MDLWQVIEDRRSVRGFQESDVSAATEHILLAATALGLGSCWVGAFDEGAAARALDLPAQFRPVAMVPLGQPASGSTGRTARRPLAEVSSLVD